VDFPGWYLLAGLTLVFMALGATVLKRLPLSSAMLYLALGYGLATETAGVLTLDLARDAALLERITELAVLVSLFSAGLKLRLPLRHGLWRIPLRLASVSMVVTVAGIALLGVSVLGLSPGAAVLLGAVLAPTDPVLASDVQVADPYDRDHLRFGLTGEAGMNDGTAFPFVVLGLGLLGQHEIGPYGLQWLLLDVLWATLAAICIGVLFGALMARAGWALRGTQTAHEVLDDFVGLGLIAVVYGLSLWVDAWGFLAVFFAGCSPT